eukprot:EG_transcript_15941
MAGLMAARRLAARAPRAAPDTAVWLAMGVAVDEWDAFASAAAGEWEGFLVELDARGQPKPLPDHAVPGANKEWGVPLYDWQLQTCAAAPAAEGRLELVQRRFYPTQGCEVDATTVFDKKARSISKEEPGLLYHPDGSYSVAPVDTAAHIEVCLVDPSQRQRVRLTLQRQGQTIHPVSLAMEWWEGPFNPDGSLPTSCGGLHPMLSSLPMDAEALEGFSRLPGGVSYAVARGPDGGAALVTVRWAAPSGPCTAERPVPLA